MSALIGPAQSPDLHVMSFNVRRRMTHVVPRSPDLWSRRRPAVHKLLATEQPTILGVQEALPDQAQVIAASLGQHYKRIGRGRNAQQRGEGCPVFFDSRRLRLTGWRQLALSDTPEVPGSRSWGNFVPRLIVCASFADRSTGQEFRFLNTHFDHLSRKSRLRSPTW
jgi:endonuclease/exonuclease/phosphatase family metal-dependent hydrolase